MKHVIFFPGLGTDERLFRNIDVNGCRKQFIKWVKPARNESLQSYLLKLKDQIIVDEPPVLVGVSLGGIMAMEMREVMPVEKTIIISSIKARTEMPAILNLVYRTNLNNIVLLWITKKLATHGPVLAGMRTRDTQPLLLQMLADADDDFLKWGMQCALSWQRKTYDSQKLVHIHGTRDLIFPLRNIRQCHYTIKGGTHGMIMSRPAEISNILSKEIF